VITACRDHWQINVPSALENREPEGIHQVRVGLRRLRSALTLFKDFIPETQRTWLAEESRWLFTQLGPARDLDVFINSLADPVSKRVSQDAPLAALMRAAGAARVEAQAAARKALRSKRAARFTARLDAWLSGRGWRTGAAEGVDAKVSEYARQKINKRLR